MALSRRPEAVEILAEIRARGMEARVSPDNAHVQYRPVAPMPIELARRLLAHRWEVMALLSADDPEVIWRVVACVHRFQRRGRLGDCWRGRSLCLSEWPDAARRAAMSYMRAGALARGWHVHASDGD